ncbi:MAG TPA: DUF3501 family protein [Arenicellales bacterium]|nr:DUF3501 family protein [Arenicellales bacterium]
MSKPLTRDDLYSLEQYAQERAEIRARVMQHKKNRTVHLGDHATLYFEDRLTIQYQIQEMLRVEKIFEPEGIEDELAAYNPLIPDGRNLKATFMIEYPDVEERKRQLARLVGIEDKVWLQVEGYEPVYAVADEDLERETEDKTSSVHFLRFEFSEDMCRAAKEGAAISAGVEHSNYKETVSPLPGNIRDALAADFD